MKRKVNLLPFKETLKHFTQVFPKAFYLKAFYPSFNLQAFAPK